MRENSFLGLNIIDVVTAYNFLSYCSLHALEIYTTGKFCTRDY